MERLSSFVLICFINRTEEMKKKSFIFLFSRTKNVLMCRIGRQMRRFIQIHNSGSQNYFLSQFFPQMFIWCFLISPCHNLVTLMDLVCGCIITCFLFVDCAEYQPSPSTCLRTRRSLDGGFIYLLNYNQTVLNKPLQ